MSADPRTVGLILEDLAEQLLRWSKAAGTTLVAARYDQQQRQELLDQTAYRASIAANQAEEDRAACEGVERECAEQLRQARGSIPVAEACLAESTTALGQAQDTLKRWQAELERALTWLQRARARLAAAVARRDFAEQTLEAAVRRLRSAESALSRCRFNRKKLTCSGEERAVESARAESRRAEEELRAALAEVEAAEAEVAAAEARVACCQRAVAFSEEAVDQARQAVRESNDALAGVERSVEHGRAAERWIAGAAEELAREQEALDGMQRAVGQARAGVDAAWQRYRHAEQRQEAAHQLSSDARQELSYRLDRLVVSRGAPDGTGGLRGAKDEA